MKKLSELAALNRRNFVKLVVGGGAGITLSPLPWKLTDDVAIWTQNWPWVPVPPKGAFSYANSLCTLCPGGCGITVRKVDDRPVKIEGRTDYPVNPGGICPLGAGGLQLLYSEELRFTGPMWRVGRRGSGNFREISWEEALNEMAERIGTLRQNGNPEALVALDGTPARSSLSFLVQRFVETIGSPNYIRIPSAEDTYAMANALMAGYAGPMAYDLENSDFILSFGCGLIDGWGAPGRMLNAWGLWHSEPLKGKVKIVQIESRASNTASKADQWLAPRPGTEAALALGLAHVLIKEGLFDSVFVSGNTFGFTDWTSGDGERHMGFRTMVLKKHSPLQVASLTGLSEGDIVGLAREFAKAKAPVALCGKGKGNLSGSLFEFMAIQALNALVGNINKPGGVIFRGALPLSSWDEPEKDSVSQAGLMKSRLDGAGGPKFPFAKSLVNNLAEAILKGNRSPVGMLLLFSGNPAYTLPDGGKFRNALEKIPFIVSFSPYKDESSLLADLVLPDHTYLEKIDDVVWPRGIQYPLYGLTQPVVKPLYDTKATGDVIISLAKMMGGALASSFPWENFDEALKARGKGLFESEGGFTRWDASVPLWNGLTGRPTVDRDYADFDDMWKKISLTGLWCRPTHPFGNFETLFETPSGKFEFYSRRIEAAVNDLAKGSSLKSAAQKMELGVEGDEACMPHHVEAASPRDNEEYPLLMVPYELINVASASTPNPPYLKKTLLDDQLRGDESFVDINPNTASEYRLRQGDHVFIEAPGRRVEALVNLFEGAMPGVLYLPMGLGHTAYDDYHRNKGVNPNDIVDDTKEPLSGMPVWWRTRVKIVKA